MRYLATFVPAPFTMFIASLWISAGVGLDQFHAVCFAAGAAAALSSVLTILVTAGVISTGTIPPIAIRTYDSRKSWGVKDTGPAVSGEGGVANTGVIVDRER